MLPLLYFTVVAASKSLYWRHGSKEALLEGTMKSDRVLIAALAAFTLAGMFGYAVWESMGESDTPATQEFVLLVGATCLCAGFGLAQLIHWSLLGGFRTINRPRFPWRIVRVKQRHHDTPQSSGSDLRIGRHDSWS